MLRRTFLPGGSWASRIPGNRTRETTRAACPSVREQIVDGLLRLARGSRAAGGTGEYEDDDSGESDVLKGGGHVTERGVSGEQAVGILGVGPGAQVECGVAAVGVAEVDEPGETARVGIDEYVFWSGIGVQRDRIGVGGGDGEPGCGDGAEVDRIGVFRLARRVARMDAVESLCEALEGVAVANPQVGAGAVAGQQTAAGEPCLVDAVNPPQGSAEILQYGGTLSRCEVDVADRCPGDSRDAQVLDALYVPVPEDPRHRKTIFTFKGPQKQRLLGEAGPGPVGSLGLHDDATVQEVGASLATAFVDLEQGADIWGVLPGRVKNVLFL